MAEYRRVGSVSTGFESSSTQMSKQPPPPSRRPNVPSRPAPNKTNPVPSKDQNKPPNTFFKKLTITSKRSSRPHQDNRHKLEANNRKTTSFYKFSEPKPNVQAHSRPTIIRSQYKKKAPPPRPPPPNLNGAPTNIRCPSYDEVVQADLDAFIGEMNAPRNAPDIPLRPRPPMPSSARGNSMPPLPPPTTQNRPLHKPLSRLYPLSAKSETALIDFDSSPTPLPKQFAPAVAPPKSQSLIDLDEIFSCNDVLTPGTSYDTQLSNVSQPSITSQNNFKVPTSALPVPKSVATRNLPGSSKGEDWLQSCLRNSVNGNGSVTDYSLDSRQFEHSNSISRSPSSPTPALPPRPSNANGASSSTFSFVDCQSSISSSSQPNTPPPVPPLPSVFQSSPTEFDAPPLPPRPKQFETTPHAIALYDYAAMQSDELSFKTNELITLVHYVSEEWMLGFTDSEEGIFPTNFVKVIVPLPVTQEKTTMGPCCEALYDFIGENDSELTFAAGDIIALESRENNEWYKGTLNGQRGTFPVTYVQVLKDLPTSGKTNGSALPTENNNKCIALYDFTGEAGELSFHQGDLIIITGIVSADWLQGKLDNGIEGRFPKTFVQEIDN